MRYDSVLNYVRKILKNSHIQTNILDDSLENFGLIDGGLRNSLYQNFDSKEELQINRTCIEQNAVYYFNDVYYCSYVIMWLPKEEKTEFLIIGPYVNQKVGRDQIYRMMDNLHISQDMFLMLENYYYNMPQIFSESQFKNLISTLADEIWQGNDNYKVYICDNNFFQKMSDMNLNNMSVEEIQLSYVNMKALESQYEFENRCMNAVSSGNQNLIDQLIVQESGRYISSRTANSLRDYKNYMIIFNALLRKAAEYGGVHPVYLERLSAKFAARIEAVTSSEENMLLREMLHRYCLLVHNRSVKQYSATIQKMVNYINLNLKEDLSLKILAERLHLSASYLSTLSKKELGMTLTDYVNNQRIEYAIFLLNVTSMQVQEIASDCGFNDITYFTRTFKKFKGMTPTRYRELISKKI